MKKRKFITIACVALALIAGSAFCFFACNGPEHEEPLVSKGKLEQYKGFKSKYVNARTIRVWIPSDYNRDSLYNVIYMHDGQMLYDDKFSWNHQEWGVDEIVDSLMRLHLIPPTIVVGIDNDGENRISEFCSDDAVKFLKNGVSLYEDLKPMGNLYLKFVVEEVKPFIDRRYSTYRDREHTFMIGSSCGGLISSYALCKYPDIFGGVACLSTHCTFLSSMTSGVQPASTDAYIEYLKNNLPEANTRLLYMDCGDKTLDEAYVGIMKRISGMIRHEGWDKTHFEYRFVPGAAHTEDDWRIRLPHIIEFLEGVKISRDRFY